MIFVISEIVNFKFDLISATKIRFFMAVFMAFLIFLYYIPPWKHAEAADIFSGHVASSPKRNWDKNCSPGLGNGHFMDVTGKNCCTLPSHCGKNIYLLKNCPYTLERRPIHDFKSL